MLVTPHDIRGPHMDRTSSTGFFKQNRGAELGMMILGLVLFIALGVRGLQRIGDMRVAAGERNRLMAAQADSELQTSKLPGNPLLLSSLAPQPAENPSDPTSKNTHSNNENNSSSRAETPPQGPKEIPTAALINSVKRQNM